MAATNLPPPPRWVLDLNHPPTSKSKPSSIPDPPGYQESLATVATTSKRINASSKQAVATAPPARKPLSTDEMDILKVKKAWEVAFAPAKSLPMSAIGMYMAGNTLQIFSIFMLFQLFKAPLQALMNLNAQFVRFESEGTRSKILLAKVVFVLTNLLALGMGIYKIDSMGLLPTTRSDWLAWETQRVPLERAYPAFDT